LIGLFLRFSDGSVEAVDGGAAVDVDDEDDDELDDWLDDLDPLLSEDDRADDDDDDGDDEALLLPFLFLPPLT